MFRIREGEEAIRRGVKVCVRAKMAKKFVSKVSRASERGASRAGRVRLRPLRGCQWAGCQRGWRGQSYALLTRM